MKVMKERQIDISIILPIYNVERFLSQCIDSILNQTFKNFELICVDDGSTDKSLGICESYALKDTRIKIIHESNSGVSAARNAGINNASGEFIGFIDGDDFISPEHFENLINSVRKSKGQMAVCGYCIQDKNNNILFSTNDVGEISCDRAEALRKLFTNQFHGSCWNKIYRTRTIRENGLQFATGICYCEDLLFNCQYLNCLQEDEKVIFESCATYHYMKYEGYDESLTTQKVSEKTTTRLDAIEEILNIELVKNCKPIVVDLKHSYVDLISFYIKRIHTWKQCNHKKAQARKYFAVYLYGAIEKKESVKSIIMNLIRIL